MPEILPRETMKKARAAIFKYREVRLRKHPPFTILAVNLVLEAKRMRRADLYA